MVTQPGQNKNQTKSDRQVALVSIQKKLRSRGVELRRFYPESYGQLVTWVETGGPFPPIVIYPTDKSGNQFLCLLTGGELVTWDQRNVK